MVSSTEAAVGYLSGLIDGEGGVYLFESQSKALIRITMTDREPLIKAEACCQWLSLSTPGVRERGTTTSGKPIYVLEIGEAESLIRASDVLDLQHPQKRATLYAIADWRRERRKRYEPKPCINCGNLAKPLRHGRCNRCRLRKRRQESA